jgi:hypothetical protein
MRWHILRTLVAKEARRNLNNRGGIALAVLLAAMALLLGAYGRTAAVKAGGSMIGGVQHCYIDYWEEGPWIDYLRARVPEVLRGQVHFRHVPSAISLPPGASIVYPVGACAIQIRPLPSADAGSRYKIWCWYPGEDRSVMAPFENWFWRRSRSFFREQVGQRLTNSGNGQPQTFPPLEDDDSWIWRESHQQFQAEMARLLPTANEVVPALELERSTLNKMPPGGRSTVASALVLFSLFFVCVYLLPSLTCEERERGALLAQALSPASALEILFAKLLFYPTVAVAFAALLGGFTSPESLKLPFFWFTVVVLAIGSLGIGLTISCIAKTQRSASMGALCYMLVISMLLLICQQNQINWLPRLALEFHGPRLMHAALSRTIEPDHIFSLICSVVLAGVWNVVAVFTFRRYGWQ